MDAVQKGKRLDALIASVAGMSRAAAARVCEAGGARVDGLARPKAYKVSPGEVVWFDEPSADEASGPMPGLEVVWEDDDVLVVNKPSGVVVHPGAGVRTLTLADALVASGRPLARGAGAGRPGIVHRLDREVSGLIAVAKTDRAYESLTEQLASRRMGRIYLALVAGSPGFDSGKIEAPIGRDLRNRTKMSVQPGGRASSTWFRVLERFPEAGAALLQVRLETGRTHQIRVHLASVDLPICADPVYGRRWPGLDRPFLHAGRLRFEHPVTARPVEVECELPSGLERVLQELR